MSTDLVQPMFVGGPQASSYYERIDATTFAPTIHTQGAWRDNEQHMAPVGGLIAHCLERHEPRDGMHLARVSYDILGIMYAAPTSVEVRTLRAGKSIELLEAVLTIGGRPLVNARAWRLAEFDSSEVEGNELEPMPALSETPESHAVDWPGGYIAGMEFRQAPDRRPGRARTWLRSPYTIVAGEASTPTAHFLRLADTANGVAVRVSAGEWAFPNVDLTAHLHHAPVGEWVGMDTHVTIGGRGHGLTSTVLHDVQGPVGTIEQILTVRRLDQR